MKLSSTQIYIQKTTHLSIFKREIVTSKSFRKCTATAARRQNSYQQTDKQYVSSIINYKNTFKVIIFSKHCFSNFSSSNIGDFTAVFCLLSPPCGLYIYIVVMSLCATAVYIVPVKAGSDLTFRKIAPEDKKHSRKQWLNNIRRFGILPKGSSFYQLST